MKVFIALFVFSTIIQFESSEKIFTAGKTWNYLVKTTKNGVVQKIDTLRLKVEKGNFVGNQQKISWSMERKKRDGSKVEIVEVTGVIENDDRIWIHPPRFEDLQFTELTAFPEIRFPIDSNPSWTSTIAIGKGWGVWENHEVESSYKVLGKASSIIDSAQCNQLNAISKSRFGTFQTSYHFNLKRGFEYIKYIRPDKMTTELKLIR